MSIPGDEDNRVYRVLMNDEEQYCLWLDELPTPAGWLDVEDGGARVRGPKQACMSYVGRVWVDMRPKSLRQAT